MPDPDLHDELHRLIALVDLATANQEYQKETLESLKEEAEKVKERRKNHVPVKNDRRKR